MSRKSRVEYIQNNEPAFIREFKRRSGIQSSDTVDSKRSQLVRDDDADGDRPDEQPQLVLDELSGVSEAEARAFLADHTIREKQRDEEKANKHDVPLSSPPDFVGPTMSDVGKSRIMFRVSSERTTIGGKCGNVHRRNRAEVHEKIEETNQDRDRSPIRENRRTNGGFLSFDPEDENG